ncbi:MAG: alpha/beta hydrolase [Acidobacteriaceae bacterium]
MLNLSVNSSQRTRVMLIWLAMIAGIPCTAQFAAANPDTLAPQFGVSSFPLWPADRSIQSTLTVFRPQPGNANHTAVIIAPGGAYWMLALNLEGRQVADWFAERGVTAFVLKYRLGDHHPYPEPLLDGQRAVRLVRSMSSEFHLDQNKIGFVGFSAGGHLAAMVATTSDNGNPNASDAIDRFSDRPDFLVLGYAWLNAMQPNDRGFITYCSVLRTLPEEKCKAWENVYTPSLHVTATTPTTFIYGTTDDKTVPVSASVDFYSALIKAGVPAEIHLFRHGGHGSGLGQGDPALEMWPILLENWLRAQGFL